MNLDDQLRDVYADLASQAPDADRIRAGIASRVKTHRQRRLLLGVGGTAAAAAAFGLPVLLLREDVPATADALLRPVRGRGYPMPFNPSWLPEGYELTERRITTGVPGPQKTVWQLDPTRVFPEITVNLALQDVTPTASSNVDLTGSPAWVHHEKHLASCTWQPMAGVELRVTLMKEPDDIDSGPEYAEIVQRIARSAKAGATVYLRPTLSFGWLPDQPPLRRVFARFYDGGEHADIIRASTEESGTVIWAGVADRLQEDVNLAEREKTTVRGRPAWYSPPPSEGVYQGAGSFVVELPGGGWLMAAGDSTAGFTITKAELVRVIEAIQLD